MRKWIFWGIVTAGLIVMLLGYLGSSPPVEGADGATVDDWYADRVWWVAFYGAVAGGVAAILAHRVPKHVHGNPAEVFLGRVTGWGLVGLAGAAFIALAYAAYCAVGFFSNLSEIARIIALLLSLRGFALMGEAVVAAGVVFWLATGVWQWGGRPALSIR